MGDLVNGRPMRLARTAERMASAAFQSNIDELVALADGDLDAVHEAIQEVQTKARTAGTPEHIAFTLLAATWKRVAEERRPPGRARS